MRIGFGLALVLATLVGLGLGAGYGYYQSRVAQPAAAAAKAAGNSGAVSSGQAAVGQAAAAGGGRPLMGVVERTGEKEFSLKASTGPTATATIVRLDEQTAVTKQITGTVGDIQPGSRISVQGEAGADGVVAATSVQLLAAEGMAATSGGAAGSNTRGQRPQVGAPPGAQTGAQPGAQGGQFQGRGTAPGGAAGLTGLVGTVREVAAGVATVARGGEPANQDTLVKVALSERTRVMKTAAGGSKDLAEGASVVVVGERLADGVIVATSVQILASGVLQPMERG